MSRFSTGLEFTVGLSFSNVVRFSKANKGSVFKPGRRKSLQTVFKLNSIVGNTRGGENERLLFGDRDESRGLECRELSLLGTATESQGFIPPSVHQKIINNPIYQSEHRRDVEDSWPSPPLPENRTGPLYFRNANTLHPYS